MNVLNKKYMSFILYGQDLYIRHVNSMYILKNKTSNIDLYIYTEISI